MKNKDAALRPNKSYCTKHSLFHGMKYKSCTPERSVEDEIFNITGHKSTFQNKRVEVYGKLREIVVDNEIDATRQTILDKFKVPSAILGADFGNEDVKEVYILSADNIKPIECACHVHRTNDPEKKQTHCLGHGLLCPCTRELLEAPREAVITDIKESPEMPADASK
jgi:hypothetical protein